MPGRDANLYGPMHQTGATDWQVAICNQDLAAANGNIFTITGLIRTRHIVGTVTTVLATSTSLRLFAGATAMTASTTITTLTTTTALHIGATALTSALVSVVGGTASVAPTPVEVLVGSAGSTTTMKASLDASGTGVISWSLEYLPLSVGAKATAAQ